MSVLSAMPSAATATRAVREAPVAHAWRISGDSIPLPPISILDNASTPQACVNALQQRASALGQLHLESDTLAARFVADAQRCGHRFPPSSLHNTEALRYAAIFYRNGHMTTELFSALDTIIGRAENDSVRARELWHYIGWLREEESLADMPVWVTRLEGYATAFEQSPGVTPLQAVEAERQLAESYGEANPKREVHVKRAVELIGTIPVATQRTPEGIHSICGVKQLAANQASRAGNAVQAVAAIDGCLVLQSDEIARQTTAPDSTLLVHGDMRAIFTRAELLFAQKLKRRYAMVGHPAPTPLAAPQWLNAPVGMTQVDLTRPVTIVEFTWTACPNCEKGYPVLRALNTRYQAKGIQMVLLTYLMGHTPESDSVSAVQELAYDQRYWCDGRGLNVPIGVVTSLPSDQWRINAYPPLFEQYGVSGAPTYYVFDRHGVVRFVREGHTDDLEAQLTAVVEKLLHES